MSRSIVRDFVVARMRDLIIEMAATIVATIEPEAWEEGRKLVCEELGTALEFMREKRTKKPAAQGEGPPARTPAGQERGCKPGPRADSGDEPDHEGAGQEGEHE